MQMFTRLCRCRACNNNHTLKLFLVIFIYDEYDLPQTSIQEYVVNENIMLIFEQSIGINFIQSYYRHSLFIFARWHISSYK